MKVYRSAILGWFALAAAACGQTVPTSPSAVVGASVQASGQLLAAKAGAIDICHRAGSGFNLISINENAWPAHQAHGDGVPSGPVPGSAMVFSATCVATTPASPAAISATPSTVNFGDVAAGASSPTRVITVKNNGGSTTSHLGGVTMTPNLGDFVIVSNTCTPQVGPLAPNGTCDVAIRFVPQSSGARTATFTINAEQGGTATSTLTGVGVAPAALSFFPASLSFTTQPAGTTGAQSVTVVNAGTAPVNMTIAISGTNAVDFTQTNSCGSSIAPGAFCTITVTLQSATSGAKTASMNVSGTQVPLSGLVTP